jgi:hypothetical protein
VLPVAPCDSSLFVARHVNFRITAVELKFNFRISASE